jgi:hypothetical protein
MHHQIVNTTSVFPVQDDHPAGVEADGDLVVRPTPVERAQAFGADVSGPERFAAVDFDPLQPTAPGDDAAAVGRERHAEAAGVQRGDHGSGRMSQMAVRESMGAAIRAPSGDHANR